MVPIARPGALAYDYADPLGFRALGEADVFHLRAFGSDGLRGLSPLKFARQTVSAALAADEVSNKLFANGVRPSGVLQMDQVLKPDQRKDLRENVIAPLAGSGYPPQEPTGSRLHRTALRRGRQRCAGTRATFGLVTVPATRTCGNCIASARTMGCEVQW